MKKWKKKHLREIAEGSYARQSVSWNSPGGSVTKPSGDPHTFTVPSEIVINGYGAHREACGHHCGRSFGMAEVAHCNCPECHNPTWQSADGGPIRAGVPILRIGDEGTALVVFG